MSFILDALKKSEAERQRQSTPGIADVAEVKEKQAAPRWLWIVGALLAINLIVLAVLLLRPDAQPPTTAVVTAEPASAEQPGAVTSSAPPASFSDMVTEAKRRQPAPVDVDTRPLESTPAAPEPEPVEPSPPPRRQTPATTQPSTLTQAYPTFNEVRAAGTLQLPDLHLDIHVYSAQPRERFVFVNMSKYTEHNALSEGPMVREIVPEGVILEYRGTEFLLPRQ